MKQTLEEIRQEYADLAHAMQSGVAMWMQYESHQRGSWSPSDPSTSPKHLRTGINSAMVEHGALAGLLFEKGIITELEYYTALRDGMRREVETYRKLISDHLGGAQITLR